MQESILIVEDDETIRVMVSGFLERQGYTIEAAETGQQALAANKARNFSLVLLDLRLPDMSGLAGR